MYLFKRASDDQWVFGENIHCEISAGLLSVEPSADLTQIMIRNSDGSVRLNPTPVTSFKKENGDAYADFAALKAGYAGFFFRVGGTGFSNGYLVFPNLDTGFEGMNVRIGTRVGYPFAWDRELIAGGFSGAEGVGWENLGGSGPA